MRVADFWGLYRRGTLFSDEHMREKAQGYVMVYDMLLGKGSIQGGGKLKVCWFCRHKIMFAYRGWCTGSYHVVKCTLRCVAFELRFREKRSERYDTRGLFTTKTLLLKVFR